MKTNMELDTEMMSEVSGSGIYVSRTKGEDDLYFGVIDDKTGLSEFWTKDYAYAKEAARGLNQSTKLVTLAEIEELLKQYKQQNRSTMI